MPKTMVPRLGPLKLKAQIFCGDEAAMGPGKADLLEAIDREGSISAAGRALGMSYRRTWLLVDSMNRCWRDKLVDTRPGGGSDKGARITDCGKQVLATYRALERSLLETAEAGGLDAFTPLLRKAPLPPS
jgi:molybdate transport system regulatory protein